MTLQTTMQKLFDEAVAHLGTQRERAVIKRPGLNGSCVYRTEPDPARGGKVLKCAVGGLIADEHYKPVLEKFLATNPDITVAIARSLQLPEDEVSNASGLLTSLQNCHDHNEIEYWPERLREIAARYKVDPACIEGSFI